MCMRLHITVDDALVKLIDELAGPRGRSALIREAVENEVDRRRRWAAFERAAGGATEFAQHLPEDWIREGRERATRRSGERLKEAWGREPS